MVLALGELEKFRIFLVNMSLPAILGIYHSQTLLSYEHYFYSMNMTS